MIKLSELNIDIPKKAQMYDYFFNDEDNHTFESRLCRTGLSVGKFRKALIPIALRIKDNYERPGTYGFVFHDFTVIAFYGNKRVKIITFLKKEWRDHMKSLRVKYRIDIKGWLK